MVEASSSGDASSAETCVVDPRKGTKNEVIDKPCRDCGKPFKSKGYALWCPLCRSNHQFGKVRFPWTPDQDQLIRDRYDGRGAGKALAATLRLPAWLVRQRASELGLAWMRGDHRRWTAEEEAFLEEHAGARLPRWIAKRLGRSLSSVATKLGRLGLSRRIRDGYTVADLTLCFGTTHRIITRWIDQGLLAGKRRFGGKAAAHDSDPWRFTDEDVIAFVRNNPTAFRLDRVDQTWFLDLVLGTRPWKESAA